eukprot:545681-Alexandrium_andersonii.AAC.1
MRTVDRSKAPKLALNVGLDPHEVPATTHRNDMVTTSTIHQDSCSGRVPSPRKADQLMALDTDEADT